MAIRLTNSSRDAAIDALLKQTFTKRIAKAEKRVHDAAVRLIKRKCGAHYKKLLALPDGYATTDSSFSFRIGGQCRWVSIPVAIPVPSRSCIYENVDARDPDGIALAAACDDLEAIKAERKELKERAKGIAYRFTTAESLAKEWPLIAPFVSKEAAQLPALPIAAVTEAFKKAAA
jgi:hypothetical protein